MEGMQMNNIADLILEILKAIIIMLIWGWILYILGYVVLWVFTLGRHPKGPKSPRQTNLVSGVGLLFLIVLWSGLAGYNNFIRPS
jgi:hypothetical protein